MKATNMQPHEMCLSKNVYGEENNTIIHCTCYSTNIGIKRIMLKEIHANNGVQYIIALKLF